MQSVGRSGRCWPPRWRPASIAFSASAAPTRWRRWPTARRRCRASARSSGPGNRWVSAAKALVARDCPIDFYAGPDRDPDCGRPRAGVVDCRRSHRPGRARSRRARGFHHVEGRAGARRGRGSGAAAAGDRSGGARRCGTTAASSSRARWTRPWRWRTTPRPSIWWSTPTPAPRASATPARCSSAPWTAQVAGDYAIGSNHTLPTAGVARVRGGLHTADFVKLVSMQCVTKAGLAAPRRHVTTLARAEGLEGHARSIEVRVPRTRRPRGRDPQPAAPAARKAQRR